MAGGSVSSKTGIASKVTTKAARIRDKTVRCQQRKSCILILGMHRSGTSALAGVLHKLGCDLPASPMPPSRSNPKGFFESIKVHDFNQDLLSSAGSSWDDITPFPDEWRRSSVGQDFMARAAGVLEEEFGTATLFVLKDPRICRFAQFWIEALKRFDCTVKPVLTVRNPLEVGDSLMMKRGYSEPLGQMIWLRNVLDAERETRGMRRFHTSFEQLTQSWELVAERSQKALEVVWPKSIANAELEIARFLRDDLRHHKELQGRALQSPLLPIWLRQTYEILKQWSEDGEAAQDYAKLDRIKAEFDVASQAFGRLVRAERKSSDDLKQKAQEAEKLNADLQARMDTAAALAAEQQESLEKALREQQADNQRQREALQAQIIVGSAEAEQQRVVREKLLQEQKEASDAEREALQAKIMAITAEAERQLQGQKEASDAELEALRAKIAAIASEAEKVGTLKQSLQEQRRRTTLMDAELHQLNAARQDLEAQLSEARSEISAHRARRKEAARVIADREAKIAVLKRELQLRYEELACLERHILRSGPSWWIKESFRRWKRFTSRTFRRTERSNAVQETDGSRSY